ncbi:hypothetical protein EV651_12138 [Kribbella sp. VKM Ac-2571]|nr:hypothetical protein EV651_12138 [Kribbella sp. VKM Ac-2571]
MTECLQLVAKRPYQDYGDYSGTRGEYVAVRLWRGNCGY